VRTVLVASHLMSETALTAEHLVIIGRGRLIAQTTVADFTARDATSHLRAPHVLGAVLVPCLGGWLLRRRDA
jgi:ABC-2 type transport system ATP-binding protein